MNPSDTQPTVELALSELRRSIDVGLTEIRGQLALLLQRTEQADRRADHHARVIQELETRVGSLERHAVTRDDLDRKSARTLQILGVGVALLGIGSGALTSIIIAFLT